MTTKTNCPITLLALAMAMWVTCAPARASDTDNIIVSSAKESHVFTTYLAEDSIKIESTDGVVTLTGIAKNAAEKSLVTKVVTDIDGVNSVINNMTIAAPPIAKN